MKVLPSIAIYRLSQNGSISARVVSTTSRLYDMCVHTNPKHCTTKQTWKFNRCGNYTIELLYGAKGPRPGAIKTSDKVSLSGLAPRSPPSGRMIKFIKDPSIKLNARTADRVSLSGLTPRSPLSGGRHKKPNIKRNSKNPIGFR